MSTKTWDIKRVMLALAALAVCMFIVAGCGDDDEPTTATTSDTPAETTAGDEAEAPAEDTATVACNPADPGEFFDKELCETQLAQRSIEPEGDPSTPWLQMIEPDEMVDTSEYVVEGTKNVCFSNAANNNPWRNTGFISMEQQVKALGDEINFTSTDAEGSDETQIADIEGLVASGNCDILLVSPNTTATLTPAVEAACEELPVIVFDRGVNTDCPVTFITPIGGYAFGADGAEFIGDNLAEGDKVLALRILPGVDVLENRWEGASAIFEDRGINVVGAEFTDGDPAKTKSIVADYLEREGEIQGIWMDAGATAVAAIEAFEDAGADYPVMNGEDQMDFLRKWNETGMAAIAPVFSNFQWRTPILAAQMILNGEEVPANWVLPQNPVRQEDLAGVIDQYAEMPELFYATCGCDDLPDFPSAWQ